MNKPIKQIIGAIAVMVLAVIVYMGLHMLLTVKRIPEAYAAWDSATLVIEYMNQHKGAWPQSWDDVLSAAETLPHDGRILRGHSSNTISRIRKLVRIDWSADPHKLAQAKPDSTHIPFRVITRADGSDFPTLWSGIEPNTLVWEYLKQNAANQAAESIHQPEDVLTKP